MGKYVKKWETLKASFETNTGLARPKETVKKAIIGTVQKASGITPALQAIDNAIEKKERLTLEKALNKYHTVQEPYVAFLREELKQYQPLAADPVYENICLEFGKFIRGMLTIEDEAGKEATQLQVSKGGATAGIQFLFLEADVKNTIAKGKKDFTAYANFEKRFNLVKKTDPALAAAQTYTKAAAHTEYKNALDAIKDFQTKALAVASACDVALNDNDVKKKENEKYKDSVDSFKKAWRDLANASRTADQIRQLTAAAGG